jgi:acyl-CoA hydrolase
MQLEFAASVAVLETCFVEMIFLEQANHYGTLFGGTALSLMGKAAFVAATRHARCSVVMAASHGIEFEIPIKVGQLIEISAQIERCGRSSMTVVVKVVAETLVTGERQLAIRGHFQMVAVDERGRPIAIAGTEGFLA